MNEPHRGGHGYYGYRFNDKTKKYEIYPEEAIVIQLIALMMAAGYSLIDIAATLNLLQVKRSDKNNKPIDGKWIRRQFGFYTRYNKDNPKQVEPHYEKYNGQNGFPRVLGENVYCIISDYLQLYPLPQTISALYFKIIIQPLLESQRICPYFRFRGCRKFSLFY